MTPLAIILSTMGGCFAGALIPVINTELVLLGAAAVSPPSLLLPLVLIASISQMAGKSFLYYAGSGMIRLPSGRFTDRMNAALARVKMKEGAGRATIFVSAAVGLPPFYVMSVASGALGVDFRQFLLLGLTGRTLRFSAIVLVPYLLKTFM